MVVVGGEVGRGEVCRCRDGIPHDGRVRMHASWKIERPTGRRCRLAQKAAFGMMACVHAFDVHDAGERVAPRLVKQERVGDRDAEAPGQEQDGEQGGANAARHVRHDGNLRGGVSLHNRGERRAGLAGAVAACRFNVYTVGRSVRRTVGPNEV